MGKLQDHRHRQGHAGQSNPPTPLERACARFCRRIADQQGKRSGKDGQPRYAWVDADIPGITGVLIGRLADNPADAPIVDQKEIKS